MEKNKKSKLLLLFDEIDEEEKKKGFKMKTSIDKKAKSYYEKKFENFNKNCSEHTSNKIVGLCIEEKCQFNRLMCTDCIFEKHVGHNMINIKNIIEKYNNLKNFNQEIDNTKSELKNIIYEKKENIKNIINQIIENEFYKYFEKICEKIEDNFETKKLEFNLKEINEKYKNNSLEEFSDVLINFWNSKKLNEGKTIDEQEFFVNLYNELNKNYEKCLNEIKSNIKNLHLDDESLKIK